MTEPIITVENLSKKYRIGARELKGRTFREAVANAFTAPARNFRRLRQLTRFEDREPDGAVDGTGYQATSPGDTIWALKDVSFTVQLGEVVGIIGRNGAGKSTLLKILSRITEPTSGEVKLYGRVSSLLEVGTGFHPELTGRENIYLNGTILGMRKAEIDRKFDEIVAFSEIEKFLDTPVKRYSSGMYVRLAFAVAAHLEPEILLVDEVLAVGDAAFQKKCLGKMGHIAQEGRTVLFVSHNMQAVKELCEQAIMLDHGEIVEQGATEYIIQRYLQPIADAGDMDSHELVDGNTAKDPILHFVNIEIVQQGHPIDIAQNGKPLEILIEYDVQQKTTGLRVYFDLCDNERTLLFRSFHDEDNDGIPTVEPGRYLSHAFIPQDILAPTNYLLIIHATIHNVRTIEPHDGICIKLTVIRTGRANRAYLSDPIRGKLAPLVPWVTRKIS